VPALLTAHVFVISQKHLHHMLNNFRRLSHQIPPVVGMPPLSDNGITEAVAHAAAAVTPASFDAHGNLHLGQNPLAAMGISDDVYAGMVQVSFLGRVPASRNALTPGCRRPF
jgi:hypothetical protein